MAGTSSVENISVHGKSYTGTSSSASLDVTLWDKAEALDTAAKGELPHEVLKSGVTRLGLLALLLAGALGSLLGLTAIMAADASALQAWLPSASKTLGPAILLSLGIYGLTRWPRLAPGLVLDVSIAYLVIVALLLGLFRHSVAWTDSEVLRSWSPVALLLLLYGALVPARPSKILIWSLVAAAMDPVGLYLLRAEQPELASELSFLIVLSPFIGAGLAYASSSVIYGLTERIAKARAVGSYRLEEQLGIGGMGEVWRAKHLMLARPAAIKLIRPQVLQSHGKEEALRLIKLFDREAQATALLTSPHTIQVYDFGVTEDGAFYYVMELLDGYDLQTLVTRFGAQPPERVAHLLIQAAASIHEAHMHKLVHRDLKPANIFTCRYGGEVDFIKVLDFGLVMDRSPTEQEIEEERMVGTPAVMAPEQMRFRAPVDDRADIYALGCVAYWLLTGSRVFEAETRHDMLVMHAHQKPLPPSRKMGQPPPAGLERVVMSCLDKNPNKRPQSARELADRLAAIQFDQPWTRSRAEQWWQQHGDRDQPKEQVKARTPGVSSPTALDQGSQAEDHAASGNSPM